MYHNQKIDAVDKYIEAVKMKSIIQTNTTAILPLLAVSGNNRQKRLDGDGVSIYVPELVTDLIKR